MFKRIAFIPISSPKLRPAPPTGPDWLNEVKFDGFRIQLHKAGDDVRLFSRNGKDFTDRFPSIRTAVLRRRSTGVCVWCFDLLTMNGRDVRTVPLEGRKTKLGVLWAGSR